MDDDDDYFTPTTNTSRRLAMLFNSEETSSSGGTITGHHADPTTQFRFVAPKQPRPGRSNSSVSNSSREGQEVLLEVILSLVPQGGEKDGAARTSVTCQVVGNAVRRNFTLIITQDKLEVLRAAVDSHLSLEVVEHSTLKVTSQGHSLTLHGDAQRIEAFLMQVAIYRGVGVEGPSHQDLCVGKGHVLEEGDVAKVSCTTYTITSTALRGDKVEELKAAKVTVSGSGWESHLAGATVDSHRLVFMPKQKDGKWLPATLYYDVTVLKVRTKGGNKEKQTSGTPTPTRAPTHNGNSIANTKDQESHHTVASSDVSNSSSPAHTVTAQNGHSAESESHNTPQDASRKAALVSRMAQLGTPLLPLMPGAKGMPPHPSEATSETSSVESSKPPETQRTESQLPTTTTTTEPPVATFTSPPPSLTHNTTITTTTTTTTTTSDITPVSTTTTPSTVPTTTITSAPIASVSNQSSITVDSTLALSICQLGTSLARISDRVDLLITKVDKSDATRGAPAGREPCISTSSSSPATSDPEALMSLASGLVAHNERLRRDVEGLERKVKESQASIAALLTMNAELLEEKREMLRRDEWRMREEEKGGNMKVNEGEKKEDDKMEGRNDDDTEEAKERKEDDVVKENQEGGKTNDDAGEVTREDEARGRKEDEIKKENEQDKEDSKDKEEGVAVDGQEENQNGGDIQGITPHQVKSIIKSTLSGLFRLLSNDFSDEEQYTRSQILQTVRSGLEVAYSTMMDNLEEMARSDEGGGEEDAHEEEEEENEKSREQD